MKTFDILLILFFVSGILVVGPPPPPPPSPPPGAPPPSPLPGAPLPPGANKVTEDLITKAGYQTYSPPKPPISFPTPTPHPYVETADPGELKEVSDLLQSITDPLMERAKYFKLSYDNKEL